MFTIMWSVCLVLIIQLLSLRTISFTINKWRLHHQQQHKVVNRRYSLFQLPLARSILNENSLRATNLSDEEEEGNDDEEEASPVQESVVIAEDSSMSLLKEGIKFVEKLNGSDVRVGIIMARWNEDIIQGLYKGVNESLTECGVKPSNVFTTYVPGSFELPITARFLAASKRVDAIICLGCLIKGETMHFEYIAQATATGIMQVSLESYVPCIFGVLTVLNKDQAIARSTGEKNEGLSWGKSAVEMGLNRMSALGLDKKPTQQGSEKTPFVNFNTSITTNNNNNNSTKVPKKIAF